MKNKCINCIEHKRCKDSYTSWIFFIIGLIATISIRIVMVVAHINPLYGKIAWYTGVGGFLVFFMYKFRVSQQRARLIRQRELMEKINNEKQLTKEDYGIISAILCALSSRKERINYIFIFGLSIIAILLAIYMDFAR